jgi:hydrogenase expression/formation protein HypD
MRYIEGFRDPKAAAALRRRITEMAAEIDRVHIMEVCGTHTMAISRYGIRSILPDNIELVSGPGCPVCVTDAGYVDAAVKLAQRGMILATFGDLLHVPGSERSLAECRAQGASLEVCYSPTTALNLAAEHPDKDIVFLAVGFETTIPPVTSLIPLAIEKGLHNISLLTAFKLVPPALEALLADPELRIDAFLCPAHVSAIIGADAYRPFTGPRGVPCVIAGFEPLDILLGIVQILEQIQVGDAKVDNQYARVVKSGGNPKARALMEQFLKPVDATWRGLGAVPRSGLGLKAEYEAYDAEIRHSISIQRGKEPPGCLCGEVIKGKTRPPKCPMFGKRCAPDHPVGPCMVSSEGTCSAYFRYGEGGQDWSRGTIG